MSFNENNPPTSSLLISGDMRANFLATRRHMYSANLLMDPLFECWPDTDTGVLAAWTQFGTGAAFLRETGVADRVVGDMSLRATFGVDPAGVTQNILDLSSFDGYFDGRVVTAGCFLKSATAAIGRVRISDGATTTDSAFHTGSGVFEYLDVEHVVDPGATNLTMELRVEGAGNVVFSGPTFLFSDIKPDRFIMPPMARSSLVLSRGGELFLGALPVEFLPQRPFIVEHVQLRTTVAPLGADLIGDVNQWDGASFSSMFTLPGRPTILAGANNGGAAPDGTYNRKCFNAYFGGGAEVAGDILQAEIDQTGISPNFGENLAVHVRYKTWLRPQELFAAFNMVG